MLAFSAITAPIPALTKSASTIRFSVSLQYSSYDKKYRRNHPHAPAVGAATIRFHTGVGLLPFSPLFPSQAPCIRPPGCDRRHCMRAVFLRRRPPFHLPRRSSRRIPDLPGASPDTSAALFQTILPPSPGVPAHLPEEPPSRAEFDVRSLSGPDHSLNDITFPFSRSIPFLI